MKNSSVVKKCISLLIAALFVFSVFTLSANAKEGQAVSVFIEGRKYSGTSILKNSVTYVGIREFSSFMGAKYINWDSPKKTAVVKTDNLEITSKYNSNYIIAN